MNPLLMTPLLAAVLAACGDDSTDLAPATDAEAPLPGVDAGVEVADLGGDSGGEMADSGWAEDAGDALQDAGTPIDGGSDGGSGDAGTSSRCPEAGVPVCQDEAFSELLFRNILNEGTIVEEGASPGERTYVNATAGGLSAPQSYLYARFTQEGLEKINLTDEQAFEDTSWHIAFRRYIIRLNGGVSGPSCVRGGRTAPGTTFEALTEVDPSLALSEERYFTDSCELVNDGSGLPNAPATVLASFWEYPGCVKMTGNVFVVELPDGRAVKLEVLSYYEPERQEECQNTDQVSFPSGSGNVRLRWAFL